jgi:hypothetical protein
MLECTLPYHNFILAREDPLRKEEWGQDAHGGEEEKRTC